MAQSVAATRICVQKFNDLNGNGKQDLGEPALSGWTFIIKDSHGQVVGEIKTEGCLDVQPGTYTVEEQLQSGWKPTTPNPTTITVAPQKTVNVLFGNRKLAADEQCCQFGLRLFSTLANTIKKVVIIPTNPAAVIGVFNGEEPDFTLTQSGSQYILEAVASSANPGGFFPSNTTQVLDLDFAIKLAPAMSPTSMTVRWLNASGQVIKEELVNLECQQDLSNDNYDWYAMRKRITGAADTVLFSGAEPEECEEFDGEERASGCAFGPHQVVCVSGKPTLKIAASNVVNTSTYSWTVNDNDALSTYPGSNLSYILSPGSHALTVTLWVTTGTDKVACEDSFVVCIPDPVLSIGTPQLECSGPNKDKYRVDLQIADQQNCNSNIKTYQWDFGDQTNSAGAGPPQSVAHYYAGPGPYTVKLTMTDNVAAGECSRTLQQTIPAFATTCQPKFVIRYELCKTNKKDPVVVNFQNQSQKFCQSSFEWDFGDPSSGTNHATTENASHTYAYDGTLAPQHYSVKLTMKDAPCLGTTQNPKVSTTISFDLKPVELNVKALVCPDGETHFVANTTATVKWDVTGAGLLSSTAWLFCKSKMVAVNVWNGLWGQHKGFKCYLNDGTYTVWVDALDISQPGVLAQCKEHVEFVVATTCCDKFKVKDHRDLSHAGKTYRLKFRHKVTNPVHWFNTHIVASAKIRRKKTIPATGITYFGHTKVDKISVKIDDQLREGGAHPDDTGVTCNTCVRQTPFSYVESKTNASHVKSKTTVSSRGVHKDDDLTSEHHIEMGTWQWTVKVQKPSGQDCSHWTIYCKAPGATSFVAC